MLRTRLSFVHGFVLIALLHLGCQANPAAPDPSTPSDPIPPSRAQAASAHHCLGFNALRIDTRALDVDVLSIRSAAWHFNLTGLLNKTMGVSAAIIPGESDPANGLFVMDITLQHPFATKPQFSGFDVKGVLMTPGSLVVGPLTFADTDETRLENADGYTRWWNPVEFTSPGILGYTQGDLALGSASALTATVNPYKLYADILCADCPLSLVSDEPLDGDFARAVFRAGNSNTRRYEIRFEMDPGPQVIYGYAIDCAWDLPDPNPPEEIPDDFPIEANQPEAFRVGFVPTVNTLFYDTESGVGGGVLRLQINVHDWQGQLEGDISAQVSAVRIFAPELMAGGVDASFLNETPTKARYTADLTDLAFPPEPGEAVVVCRAGSSDGSTYQQGAAPAPDSKLSAYQVVSIDIPDPVCTTDGNNSFLEAVAIDFGDSVVDQVCHTEDSNDYYSFEIPLGYAARGEARLQSAPGLVVLALYDESEEEIISVIASGSVAAIELDGLDLMPGTYFLEAGAGCTDGVLPYLLELDAELEYVVPESPVDITPRGLYVDPECVWLHGDSAFLVGNHGTWVYDISDPSNPILLAYDPEVRTWGEMCFHYPYCYAARDLVSAGQVNLIDFSNPLAPVLHEDIIHYTTRLDGVTINSTHLYVGTEESPTSEVFIYDYASDPLSPVHVGGLTVSGKPQILGLLDPEGPETHLVVGTWNDIFTYDVEVISSITQTGSFNFPVGCPRDVATYGDYICVGYDSTAGGEGWLYVLEQTNVPSLVQEGTLDVPGSASFVSLEWPYAYLGDGAAGLTICDLTDPASPSHESSLPLVSYGGHLQVGDNTVFLIPVEAGLQIVDVSTPTDPHTQGRLLVLNDPGDAAVIGNKLIIGNPGMWHRAIKALDISDPMHAYITYERVVSSRPLQLCLDGDRLAVDFFTDWGLYLVQEEPFYLQDCCVISEGENIDSLAMFGDALFVSLDPAGGPEIKIYDISDPFSPSHENTVTLTDSARSFCFKEDFVYVRTGPGVLVYYVGDPFNPVAAGSYPTADVQGMDIRGDFLHLTTMDTLEIADISVPTSPTYLGSVTPPITDFMSSITVDGQFAYVAVMDSAPQIFHVWPPDTPSYFGMVDVQPMMGSSMVVVDQGVLYTSCQTTGLRIYDLY